MSAKSIDHLSKWAIIIGGFLTTTAVCGQQLGVYRGTSSQGLPVELYVEDDGVSGPILSWINIPFDASCPDGTNHRVDYYVYVGNTPTSGQTLLWELPADFLFISAKFKITTDGLGFKGKWVGKVPALSTDEKNAVVCSSGDLSFSATHSNEALALPSRIKLAKPTQGQWIKKPVTQ